MAPSLASRAAPASPCSSPRGRAGTPMSAALLRPSRPVLTTVAASEREASSPAMFRAETVNRSHRARRARSLWPRAASQSPKRCSSTRGSPGSTRRMARAGRATLARSAKERKGYRPRAGSICRGPGSAVRRSRPRPGSGGEHGDVEPVLERGVGGHAELVQQAAVGGAAAEVDVLAGVDDQAVAGEGAGRPAEPGPGLEQGDRRARLGERDRGGDPGQAAADHGHPRAHPSLPARALTATVAFSRPDRETRPRRTAAGSAAMRSSRRR